MANRAETEETICPAHRSRAPEPGPLARKNAPAANQHAITQTGARPPKAPLPHRGKQRHPAPPQRPLPGSGKAASIHPSSLYSALPPIVKPPRPYTHKIQALPSPAIPRAPRKPSSIPPWTNRQIPTPSAANSNAARSFSSPARTKKRRHNHASALRKGKHIPFLDYFPARTSSNSLQISSEGGAVSSDTTTMHSAENTNAGNSS